MIDAGPGMHDGEMGVASGAPQHWCGAAYDTVQGRTGQGSLAHGAVIAVGIDLVVDATRQHWEAGYGDMVMRNDGKLYGITDYTGNPGLDQNLYSGLIVGINTQDASIADSSPRQAASTKRRSRRRSWSAI